MPYKDFIPSEELQKFAEANGEDTYIKLNLLYIAFLLDQQFEVPASERGFDDLCEDLLEISLDESFSAYNLINIVEAAAYIMDDSSYTVREYELTYKRNREKICEELLACLDSGEYQGE